MIKRKSLSLSPGPLDCRRGQYELSNARDLLAVNPVFQTSVILQIYKSSYIEPFRLIRNNLRRVSLTNGKAHYI
jgi:hypothetical protein